MAWRATKAVAREDTCTRERRAKINPKSAAATQGDGATPARKGGVEIMGTGVGPNADLVNVFEVRGAPSRRAAKRSARPATRDWRDRRERRYRARPSPLAADAGAADD